MDEKRPILYECQYISLSQFLSFEEREAVSGILTNSFTWGDVSEALVTQEEMEMALEKRQPYDEEEAAVIKKIRNAMDQVGDSVYISLP